MGDVDTALISVHRQIPVKLVCPVMQQLLRHNYSVGLSARSTGEITKVCHLEILCV